VERSSLLELSRANDRNLAEREREQIRE